MADAPQETETTTVETEGQTEQQEQQTRAEAPPEIKAALSKANKEAEKLRLRLQEFEDRDKTEAQRLTERAEAAERLAGEHESRAMRLEIAAEKGLTPAQAKRLVGSTREELEADADDLLENFKPSNGETETQKPKTALDLDLGSRGTTAASADQSKADLAKWLQS